MNKQFQFKKLASLRFVSFAMTLMIIVSSLCKAQTTDTLNEVNITHTKQQQISNDNKLNTFSPGQKAIIIDSITLEIFKQQNLSQLLYQQMPVFIKSYGFNALATVNFRGSSSAQSQVLWNGVPLQNAALGIADISLLQTGLFDNINLVYGSSSALWGSGNTGGVLLLENNNPKFNAAKPLWAELYAGVGSYRQFLSNIKIAYSGKKIFSSLILSAQKAANNFSYADNYGDKKQTEHAQLKSKALMFDIAYHVSEKNTLSFSSWLQQYNREIPTALFESYSDKNQKDETIRFLFNWQHHSDKMNWYAKTSFIKDWLHYNDSSINLFSKNGSSQSFTEIGIRKTIFKKAELLVFAPIHFSWMNVNDSTQKTQNKTAIAVSLQNNFFKNHLDIALSAREEVVDDFSIFLPGINASYRLNKWLDLKTNLQRTYRAPTLNELYFQPGGNAQLLPEQGWAEEISYTIHFKYKQDFNFIHDISFFNRDIRNWIIWFGGSIWTPHNIATVNSKGIEADYKMTFKLNKWIVHISANGSYINATTRSSYIGNDSSIGKQIPYTPTWLAQTNAGFSFWKLYFNYNHSYTGYRFITTDESQLLPAYQTGNMQLMYTGKIFDNSLQLILQCSNIWSSSYQVVAGRAMPGRNWLLGFGIRF